MKIFSEAHQKQKVSTLFENFRRCSTSSRLMSSTTKLKFEQALGVPSARMKAIQLANANSNWKNVKFVVKTITKRELVDIEMRLTFDKFRAIKIRDLFNNLPSRHLHQPITSNNREITFETGALLSRRTCTPTVADTASSVRSLLPTRAPTSCCLRRSVPAREVGTVV